MPHTSDRRRLAEMSLARAGADLDSVVARLRSEGLGWRAISARLLEHYGIDVHATTLMRWYADKQVAA